jgi:ankyrin repeat protein
VSIAAHNGQVAIVRALIKAGADVKKAKHNGVTPLFVAAQFGKLRVDSNCEAIVKILKDAGAV